MPSALYFMTMPVAQRGIKKEKQIFLKKMHAEAKLALFYFFFLFIQSFHSQVVKYCIMEFRMFNHTDL